MPADGCFTVRAGVGRGPDVVGVAQVGSDLSSPAGFALKTGKPVISNHLGNEQRFRTPELFARYNISRAMNVILHASLVIEPPSFLLVSLIDCFVVQLSQVFMLRVFHIGTIC